MSEVEKPLRLILNLGKYRVTERDANQMKLALGGSTTMTISVEDYMDVHAGDILTLYTEVLIAKPISTSEQ